MSIRGDLVANSSGVESQGKGGTEHCPMRDSYDSKLGTFSTYLVKEGLRKNTA